MKTVERILESLKELGLVPQRNEYGVVFQYQMAGLVYLQDKQDDKFLNFVMPNVYKVQEGEELEVLRVVNQLNNSYKILKAVVDDGSVWISYEHQLESSPNGMVLKELVSMIVRMLIFGRDRFYEALEYRKITKN